MSVVRHSSTIEVARDRVFTYINDYENVPEYMFGIHQFTPRTDLTSGKGSVFDVAIKAGPKTLKSTVETVEWVENELIVLRAIEASRPTPPGASRPGCGRYQGRRRIRVHPARRSGRKSAGRDHGSVRGPGDQAHRRKLRSALAE